MSRRNLSRFSRKRTWQIRLYVSVDPINNYYANEKTINISNGVDAMKIRIKEHELYINVQVYTKCNGTRTTDFKVIDFLAKTTLIDVNNYYAAHINQIPAKISLSL